MSTQQYPEHILKQADEMAEKLAGAFGRNHVKHEYSDVELINKELNLPALLMAREHAFNLAKSHEEMMTANASLLNQLSQHQQVVKQLTDALEVVHKISGARSDMKLADQVVFAVKNAHNVLSTAKQLLEKKV